MTSSKIESSVERKSLTFDQLLRRQALQIPDEPFVSYSKSGTAYEEFTFSQINTFAYRAAKQYSKLTMPRLKSSLPPRVVAILGTSNLDYLISMAAVTKLGWTILFLSTRISDAAYMHLFSKTNCSDVIIQPGFEKTIERVKDNLPFQLKVSFMAGPDVYNPEELRDERVSVDETAFDQDLDLALESEKTAWIIHSSGSTGLPKPVNISHRAVLNSAHVSSAGPMTSLTTLPLYHSYGSMVVSGALVRGRKITMFNANVPLTGPNLVEALQVTNPEQLYVVPYALKLLTEVEGGIEALVKCKNVCFAGSSLSDDIGDHLVSSGVNIISFYGSTEMGACLWSGDRNDNEWSYLHPVPAFRPYAQWELYADGICELVGKPGWPSKSSSNRPDGSYATNDLWAQHPTDPNRWKYFGRRDDLLVLSNGEKANPVTLELHVRENPYVKEVVVCGSHRTHLGMLVIPSTSMGQAEVIEHIWGPIEQENEQMPAYARISKEMIAVLPVNQDFPKTDKGTAIRTAFYAKFADRIEQLYQDFEVQNTQNGLELSEAELKEFIKKELVEVLMLDNVSELQDDTDFFLLGLDSLGATQVRNKIVREVKTGGKVGQNIVFEQPSLTKLARYLYRLRTGEKEVVDSQVSQVDLLEALIEKYSDFPQHVPGKSNPNGDHIIVTGATGSLGAHIVAQLAARDSVKKVYCLVRATSLENATQRTIQSLKERRVYDTLSQEQLAKIAAFPSNFSCKTLGLSPEVYEELLENVNIVIHSAWSVNFNMDVSSFEQQHIRGTYNLMSLCLKSHRIVPASFNFTSSISSVLATSSLVVSETEPTSLENAMPMGYAQSKLVAEKLSAVAAKKTTMAAHVLRVGQVVGDTTNGCWNATEAIPLTIQSALTIGCLPRPTNDEVLSWLPVDVVAKTCIELSFVPTTDVARDAIFHICNPRLISWNNGILPALRTGGLKFDEVMPTEWLARLKASNQDPRINPPIKLLEFFETKYGMDTVENVPYFKTEKASNYSKTLGECKVVDGKLVGKFMKFWRETAW